MKTDVQLHWDYLLLLEKDLVAITETVELSEKNYTTYGPRILQLILAAGSELDVALKSFAKAVAPDSSAATGKYPNMMDYKNVIASEAIGQFATARVRFLRSEVVRAPWAPLAENLAESLPWWSSYNKVKHHRAENYESANLETALDLMAALFVVDAFLSEARLDMFMGSTQIIDWDGATHRRMPQLDSYYAAK
jgi:hypothetical protein